MQVVVLVLLGAMVSTTFAHYGRWVDTRNALFDENEPRTPCLLSKMVSMKNCNYGTHENKKCDFRLDCLQGPGEFCSEKLEGDTYGLKCAAGFVCSKTYSRCVGIGFVMDSNDLVQKQMERIQAFKGKPLLPTLDY